jgi:hypothetical protein
MPADRRAAAAVEHDSSDGYGRATGRFCPWTPCEELAQRLYLAEIAEPRANMFGHVQQEVVGRQGGAVYPRQVSEEWRQERRLGRPDGRRGGMGVEGHTAVGLALGCACREPRGFLAWIQPS